MSTTVKSLKVIIGEAESVGFNITINKVVYRMDNFSISHQLLSPATLNFSLTQTDQDESPAGATFGLSGWLIGKPITVELITENVEQQSAIAKDGEKTADIKFVGFIMNVGANRTDSSCALSVSAATWEAFLDSSPNTQTWTDKNLKEVIESVTRFYDASNSRYARSIDTEYTDKIHYCVAFEESRLQFLKRLACRFGEWMYNDGEKLIFGKLPEFPPVELDYQQKDIASLSANAQTLPIDYNYIKGNDFSPEGPITGQVDHGTYYEKYGDPTLSSLQKCVVDAIDSNYPGGYAIHEIATGGYDDTKQGIPELKVVSMGVTRTQFSNMVSYYGSTYSSKLKIGVRLQIKDSIRSGEGGNPSTISHEDILITGITHSFSADESYSNSFSGIPGVCMYPPYPVGEFIRTSGPVRAQVVDVRDPENMGRVRVEFLYQQMYRIYYGQYIETADTEERAKEICKQNIISPWIPVVQPYDYTKIIPELGQLVLVGFMHGNVERPFVMGTLWKVDEPPFPEWVEEDNKNNEVKAFRTKNGHTVEFHDCGPEDKGGGFIHLYDTKKKYDMLLSTDGELVRLRSAGDIQLIAKNDITLKAGGSIGIASDCTTTIDSDFVDINANQNYYLSTDCIRTHSKTQQLLIDEAVQESQVSDIFTYKKFVVGGKKIYELSSDKHTIENQGEIEVLTQDKIKIESEQDMDMKARNVDIHGTNDSAFRSDNKTHVIGSEKLELKGTAKLTIESNTSAKMDAPQIEITGQAQAKITAPTLTMN